MATVGMSLAETIYFVLRNRTSTFSNTAKKNFDSFSLRSERTQVLSVVVQSRDFTNRTNGYSAIDMQLSVPQVRFLGLTNSAEFFKFKQLYNAFSIATKHFQLS